MEIFLTQVEHVSSLHSLLAGLPWGEPSLSIASAPATEPFWQRFLTSAGFGGLMALTAAVIAARIAARQLRHTKMQQIHERWWSTLTWVYDRAVVEKDKRTALPHHVTFAMLTQLAERAHVPSADGLQQGTIKAILSMFQASDDVYQPSSVGTPTPSDAGQPPPLIRVSDPAAASMLDDLRHRLSSDEELRARTAQITYLHSVKEVIRREASLLGGDIVVADETGHRADFAVAWQDRTVLIRVRYVDVRPSSAAVLLGIETLQTDIAADYPAIGGLIVFNTPVNSSAVDSFAAESGRPDVKVVTWRSEKDDASVRAALASLRPDEHAGLTNT